MHCVFVRQFAGTLIIDLRVEDRLLMLERSSVLSENVSQGKSYISAFRSPGGESKRERREAWKEEALDDLP